MNKHANIAEIRVRLALYNYTDYRDYLRDLFQQVRAASNPYSWERFAEDLGFSPTNVVRLISSKKRRLAKSSALKVVRALKFDEKEKKYFLALVTYNNGQYATQRNKALQELVHAKLEVTPVSRDRLLVEYFANWQTPVIREMLRDENLAGTVDDIAKRLYLGLSANKIHDALALLEKLGIVAKNGDDTYSLLDDQPLALPEEKSAGVLSLTRYHAEMLRVSREALAVVPKRNREFNALTLNLSEENFAKIKSMIRSLCNQAVEVDNNEQKRDCAAQLNIQLFMLTRPDKERSHG